MEGYKTMPNRPEMILISQLASDFELSIKDIHKILLSYSNQESFQVLSYKDSQYFLHQQIYEDINYIAESIRKDIISEEEILSAARAEIPFETRPYLYFLLQDDTLVYIGMSVDLPNRISTHNKDKTFNKVASFKRGKGIELIEKINIMHYNPIYNKDILTQEMWLRTILKEMVGRR
jgi:predicted GIY-YIG superfamily endonuclease